MRKILKHLENSRKNFHLKISRFFEKTPVFLVTPDKKIQLILVVYKSNLAPKRYAAAVAAAAGARRVLHKRGRTFI